MPRLNLRDHDSELPPDSDEPGDDMSSAPLDDYHDGGRSSKTPWIILGLLVVLAAVTLAALNQFNVIHLWGKKSPRVVEAASNQLPTPADTGASHAVRGNATPVPTETPLPTNPTGKKGSAKKGAVEKRAETKPEPKPVETKPAPQPSATTGSGAYAVQISSWPSKEAADKAAARAGLKGFTTSVVEAQVKGQTWYRVRVGTYGSSAEAAKAVTELQEKGYPGGIVVKAGK